MQKQYHASTKHTQKTVNLSLVFSRNIQCSLLLLSIIAFNRLCTMQSRTFFPKMYKPNEKQKKKEFIFANRRDVYALQTINIFYFIFIFDKNHKRAAQNYAQV